MHPNNIPNTVQSMSCATLLGRSFTPAKIFLNCALRQLTYGLMFKCQFWQLTEPASHFATLHALKPGKKVEVQFFAERTDARHGPSSGCAHA